MSYVYFARAADLIWIGTTANPHSPPALLGYLKGGEVELLAIRQRFAHLKVGEAFAATPELLQFIEAKCTRPAVNEAASERLLSLAVPPYKRATFRALAKMIGETVFAPYRRGVR